jgi:hypothetical protein
VERSDLPDDLALLLVCVECLTLIYPEDDLFLFRGDALCATCGEEARKALE